MANTVKCPAPAPPSQAAFRRGCLYGKRPPPRSSYRKLLRRSQASLVVNRDNAARKAIAPMPKHQVRISRRRSWRETRNAHTDIARRNQALGERLRVRNSSIDRILLPSRATQPGLGDCLGRQIGRIQRVEHRIGIDLVRAQQYRLHRVAHSRSFPKRRYGRQGGIKGRAADAIEPAAVEARPFPRCQRPRPTWVESAVNRPAKPHRGRAASRVPSGHDAVQIGVNIPRLAFAHEAVGRLAGKPG